MESHFDPATFRERARAVMEALAPNLHEALCAVDDPDVDELVEAVGGNATWEAVAQRLVSSIPGQAALAALVLRASAGEAQSLRLAKGAAHPPIVYGDLRVDGVLRVDGALWVLGDLVSDEGVIDRGPDSHLIVLGTLEAPYLYASGEICVLGDVRVPVVECAGNDNTLIVGRDLQARVLHEEQHAVVVIGKTDAQVHATSSMAWHEQVSLLSRWLPPEQVDSNKGLVNLQAFAEALRHGRVVLEERSEQDATEHAPSPAIEVAAIERLAGVREGSLHTLFVSPTGEFWGWTTDGHRVVVHDGVWIVPNRREDYSSLDQRIDEELRLIPAVTPAARRFLGILHQGEEKLFVEVEAAASVVFVRRGWSNGFMHEELRVFASEAEGFGDANRLVERYSTWFTPSASIEGLSVVRELYALREARDEYDMPPKRTVTKTPSEVLVDDEPSAEPFELVMAKLRAQGCLLKSIEW